MFDRLISLVAEGWERIAPYVLVHPYEQAVVLRLGAYHRTLTTGLHFKLPFFDDVVPVVTAMTTMRLPSQTLTTRDGKGVVVSAIVRYAVRDPKPYVTTVWDQVDVLADVTMGAIREAVVDVNWTDLKEAPPEASVLARVRRQVNKYGFKVEAVTFVDLGIVQSFRIIGGSDVIADLGN